MTIFYPDVSNNDPGLRVQPGTVAVCAKATEGRTFTDSLYAGFRAQSAAVGAFFFAYHWLHHGNADAQAAHCYSVVGNTPVMIDCEDLGDVPNVADCIAFAAGLRNRGGVCTTVYLPQWYWRNNLHSPDLHPLAAAGLHLVSSNYTMYTDGGPGWAPYGGVAPAIWQYSDNLPYGGQAIDFNAFRGSVAELAALVTGTPVAPDPAPPLPDPPKEPTMPNFLYTQGGQLYYSDRMTSRPVSPKAAGDIVSASDQAAVAAGTQPDLWTGRTGGDGAWTTIPGFEKAGAVVRTGDDFEYAGPVPVPAAGPTQVEVNTAVSSVMNDPAWIEQVAAALAGHIHVA